MFNFIVFGQNDRLTIRAASYTRVVNTPNPRGDEDFNTYPQPSAPPYYEFVNDTGDVVAMLSEYMYGNIVREDALQPNS